MTKDEQIFELYDKLGKSGQRHEAQKFIADKCGVRVGSVKSNYLLNKELPKGLDESIKDEIITYLKEKIEDKALVG